jgi:mono/diheme cytochrome c family protein
MAGRKKAPIDDEQKSFTVWWLVGACALFVGALWALYDDNIARRPWKAFQAHFSRLEIGGLENQIATEQARLDGEPAYQEAVKKLDEARTNLDSREKQHDLDALRAELHKAELEDLSKDLNLRFVKSELEEMRFEYDEALHHGGATADMLEAIKGRQKVREERQRIYDESQLHITQLQNRIKDVESGVKKAQDALDELTTKREDLKQKLENVSLGYLPGPKSTPPFFGWEWQPKIPKIQQVVLDEFDHNNFDQSVARVDRCTSCHAGINKAGFDDQPNPYKTHPKRELLLGKHPPEKFACTPCHNGQGPAVNSPREAHGNFINAAGEIQNVEFIEHPMNRGPKVQANCIKCHAGVQHLAEADVIGRGEMLFEQLGCHGCHLTEGYEELSKMNGVSAVGPSLRRIDAKLDHGWMVDWVKNPHVFRPRTRMPNFDFSEEQATEITAYLLYQARGPSAGWVADHPEPAISAGGDAAARGKELVDSLGCRACHAFAPGEVAGQLGANKDIAPNLSRIAEKTDARWIYHWIKNPRGYSDIARMPNLRLSDDEAAAVTAYLLTLGKRRPTPESLEQALAKPENVAAGEKLVRKYGCPGCHDIPGMETESRIGVELSTFGSKTKEELFFGDQTQIPETWDAWTYHKLQTPRIYATRWIEQLMPQFDLAEEDIIALRVFLASRTEGKIPAKYVYNPPGEHRIVEGRLVVARYNCTGCHIIEGRGGDIRRLYEEQPTMAPPILRGEGRKVQADWLFGFLENPGAVKIRPWLKLRMPTFGLSRDEANTLVDYFDALDDVEVPFFHIDKAALSAHNVEIGKLLMSKDYFDCFNCHQRGAQTPEGPPSDWAPDLSLAARRLNPNWIVDWIRDPQKLMPGTKMPSFFPGGPPDVLDGDEDAQIRAMRDYIMSLGLGGSPATASPQQAVDAAASPSL